MIKARATGSDGDDILIFGIDEDNIRELRKGRPLSINLTEMGLKGKMVIFWGKDMGALQEIMAPFLSSDTEISDHRDGDL